MVTTKFKGLLVLHANAGKCFLLNKISNFFLICVRLSERTAQLDHRQARWPGKGRGQPAVLLGYHGNSHKLLNTHTHTGPRTHICQYVPRQMLIADGHMSSFSQVDPTEIQTPITLLSTPPFSIGGHREVMEKSRSELPDLLNQHNNGISLVRVIITLTVIQWNMLAGFCKEPLMRKPQGTNDRNIVHGNAKPAVSPNIKHTWTLIF